MSLKTNKKLLLILSVICVFIIIPSAFADEINENQTDTLTTDSILADSQDVIYVSSTGNEKGNGSELNPYNSISTAFEHCNSSNLNIFIKNGEYSFENQLDLNKDVKITGESFNGVVLNGNHVSSIFKVSGNSNIVFTNLTFKNGYSPSTTGWNNAMSSSLHISYANHVSVNNCIFENQVNSAIASYSSSATIDIKDSIFRNNTRILSSGSSGGAIHVYGGKTLNITNSIFERNYANSTYSQTFASHGGAIYLAGNLKTTVIDRCKFYNNNARTSGAIGAYCAGDISIFNSIFENNTDCVIYDEQRNLNNLILYLKNNTFDVYTNKTIVVKDKVTIVNLDPNDRITGNNVNINVGDDEYYTITLTDDNSTTLEGKTVHITFVNSYNNVIEFINTTNSLGQITIPLNTFNPGRYSVLARFEGDGKYDEVETTNKINIKTVNPINIVITPDYVKMNEGDSVIVVGTIHDEYMELTTDLNGEKYHVEVLYFNDRVHSIHGGLFVDGSSFTFDLNTLNLITRNHPYNVKFIFDDTSYSYYYGEFVGNVTVDLSISLPNVGNIDVIHVATNGNDSTGNGSENNPLATVQMALNVNRALGGGKTIIVDEGVYEISNFHIINNVTIRGTKGKTIFKQPSGNQGMFKIDQNAGTVNLKDIIFTDGYTTPQPYSLITAYGANVIVNIDNCKFINNTCLNGGAIAASHKASVYINNSQFYNNKAIMITSEGGAISISDAYAYVANCEFINNTGCDGGAIYVNYGGILDIVNSTFINNTAIKTTIVIGGGGAIYTRGTTTIKNSTFINNFADLYGGSILMAGGDLNVKQSYFKDNKVGAEGSMASKAKDIQVQSGVYYYNFNVEYSVFVSSTQEHLFVMHNGNLDYANVSGEYNYWGSNSQNANTNIKFTNQLIIQAITQTTPVHEGDNVKINVEFKNRDVNGVISTLKENVHEYTLDVSSGLNEICPVVTIANNIGQIDYHAKNIGEETITIRGYTYSFKVLKLNKENANPNIVINSGYRTLIVVNVPIDLANNVTICVNGISYSRANINGNVTLEIYTIPNIYNVNVSYEGDDKYNPFSKLDSFKVDKYDSNVVVVADNIYSGENAIINVTVNPATTGSVTITVDAKQFTKQLVNGSCSFNISGLYIKDYENKLQVYRVIAKFNGNNLYDESTGITSFNVTKKPTEPIIPEKEKGYAVIYVTPGENSKILIRVPYNLKNNVTVKVNDVEYSLSENEGKVVLIFPTNKTGNYTVSVDYAGDENVTNFTGFATFKVDDYLWFIDDVAYRSIYDAVAAAKTGDVIKGTPGVYEIYSTIDIGHRYMPIEPWSVNKTVTITSLNSQSVIFKGDSRRIFFVDIGSDLTLKNLIFEGANLKYGDGGAVENMYDSNLTIENCTFKNLSADRGGAIFVWGNTTIKDSKFINNKGKLGGAIFVLGSSSVSGSFIVDNVEFINNTATSFGGALYFEGSNCYDGFIKNSKFIDNVGNWRGGAIYLSYSNMTIDNTIFNGNKAISENYEVEIKEGVVTGPCGCIIDTSDVVVRNATAHIDAVGGAIYVSNYANEFISNSQFNKNVAEFGGALGLSNSITGITSNGVTTWTTHWTTINNCTFKENEANISAGAIYIGYSGVPYVNISNSEFDSNVAPDSSAILNDFGALNINNTEFKNHVNKNGTLITTFGTLNMIEEFNAVTVIENSRFINNKVESDIYQSNQWTVLNLTDSIFDGENTILTNRGLTTLSNVSEINKISSKPAIVNYGTLRLFEYSFLSSVYNNGTLTGYKNSSDMPNSKVPTKFSFSNTKLVYNGGKQLIITLKDSNNKIVSDANIVVTLNNKVYKLTTNKKGQVSILANIVPKTYNIKLSFAGNDEYNSVSSSVKIVVKKATPKLTISNKPFKVKAKYKKITATLKNNKGKALKKARITLKIKGKIYKAKTNKRGVATFKVKVNKKGTYNAIVKFGGSNYYKSLTKKVKVKIK